MSVVKICIDMFVWRSILPSCEEVCHHFIYFCFFSLLTLILPCSVVPSAPLLLLNELVWLTGCTCTTYAVIYSRHLVTLPCDVVNTPHKISGIPISGSRWLVQYYQRSIGEEWYLKLSQSHSGLWDIIAEIKNDFNHR